MAQSIVHSEHTADLDEHGVRLYGLIAEFDDPHQLVVAARRVHDEGYNKVDAYTPLPVEGLSDALGHRDLYVPYLMLAAGIGGAILGFGFLAWTSAVDYPLNIGGRPLFGWPQWIPITFEVTVLLASLTGIVGMLMLNGLPQPYHPVFDAPNFARATSDRFFLCIEADDPHFDRERTGALLDSLGALRVSEIDLRK